MVEGTSGPIGSYPFSAVVGQDHVKRALLCALIDDRITSVLIIGGAGVAKSTLVRSLPRLTAPRRLVTVPVNVTAERLTGGMDLEVAISEGRRVREAGLLEEADGNILFLDQVNLMDEELVLMALTSAEEGGYTMARDGFSSHIDTDFLLIGAMDPREGGLSAHVLDRFDLCVTMETIDDPEGRLQIVDRRMGYEVDGQAFIASYEDSMAALDENIGKARERLPYVMCSEGHLRTIARLCLDLGVEGHRGDLAMVRASRCLAALDGRDGVNADDLKLAAQISVQHRRRDDNEAEIPPEERPQDEPERTEGPQEEGCAHPEQIPPEAIEGADDPGNALPEEEQVYEVGEPFRIIQFLKGNGTIRGLKSRGGRRRTAMSNHRHGRYVSSRTPNGKVRDIALDATIRAAAPYQLRRRKEGRFFVVEPSDLREKVRKRKDRTTIMFLVDASGSMGVRRRMVTVKGAILSILKDAYQKRDMVGLMIFSNDAAPLILPPTKSVDLAYHKLRTIPTGGRTPLPLALMKVSEYLRSPRYREEERMALVIVTDGRANEGLNGGDPLAETLAIARNMSALPIEFVVVDSEVGYPRMGRACLLSETLGGSYFRLEGLDADQLASSVGLVVHSAGRA
jgi:magnesium chelatase subunit D